MRDDMIVNDWIDALQAAYRHAWAARTADLNFRPVRRFDARGIHPFSEECGRIAALQSLEPVLANAGFDPVKLKRAAEQDAQEQFIREAA